MSEVAQAFQNILRVSLSLTPVLAALLLLAPRLGRRYSPGLRCTVWLAAALRLLVPGSLSLSLPSAPAPAANLLERIDQNAVAQALSGLLAAPATGEAATGGGAASGFPVLAAVWAAGAAVYLGWNLAAYRLTLGRLRRWSVPVADPLLQKALEDCKARLAVRGNVTLHQAAGLHAPMLAGYLHPRIYLPDRLPAGPELADILAHELCHYKRKDLWFKLALLAAAAAHWFNPAVHLMLRQAELDMEMACDSAVLRDMDPAARQRYGLAILSYVECGGGAPLPLTTNFNGGKGHMKIRFAAMVDRSKKKPGLVFFTACLALIVFSGALTGAAPAADSGQQAVAADPGELSEATTPPDIGMELSWPLPGGYQVIRAYGWHEEVSDFHTGIDLAAPESYGAPVTAAQDGVVAKVVASYTPGLGYGQYVVVDHGQEVTTLYAHLSGIFAAEGDMVERGQVIAAAGATGFADEPHLHFEVRVGGVTADPAAYIAVKQVQRKD